MKTKRTQLPQPFKTPAPLVASDQNKLLVPVSGWVSLLLCVETYKAKVLASTIEQYGLFVYDRFNRRVAANDGPSTDLDSKYYALDLIASVAEEERNPGPLPSWNHERWDFEEHPLQRFGWPKESLPDLEAVKNNVVVNTAVSIKWTERTKSEFEAEKIKAGSFEAAGKLHGVSRTRYTKIYKKVTGATKSISNATGVQVWGQLGARKK